MAPKKKMEGKSQESLQKASLKENAFNRTNGGNVFGHKNGVIQATSFDGDTTEKK